jgi:hypothetical protein
MEGKVKIKLDRERKLYFDINTIAEVDDQLRLGVVGLFRQNDWRVSDVRLLLWAGLKAEDPALTIADVGRLIQERISGGGMLFDITEAIRQAFVAAGFLREAETEKKTDEPPSPSIASANGSPTPSETPTDH